MKNIKQLRSYFNSYRFYKGIFSPFRMIKPFVNIVTGRYVGFPLTIDILVTEKCNLCCNMCWFGMYSRRDKVDVSDELSSDEIEAFLEDIAVFGPVIHFGGGEPFAREDMPLLIEKAKQQGLKCIVTTNGTLLNDEIIERITASGLDSIIFSIYGDEKHHDMICGSEGAYSSALENLLKLKAAGKGKTRIYVSSIFSPQMVDLLDRFIDKFRTIGVDGVKIEHLNFITERELNKIKEMGLKEEISTALEERPFSVEFAETVAGLSERLKKKYGGFILVKPFLTHKDIIEWYSSENLSSGKCVFEFNSAAINSRGEVIPCQFLPGIKYGNIREEKFTKIWKEIRNNRKSVRQHISFVCNRCCKR